MMTSRCAPVAIAAALLLSACNKGGGGNDVPAPITIPDPALYLAQARCPGDALPLACDHPMPQKAGDQVSWRRFDGQDQIEDSVVSDDGSVWITTWSYWPHAGFIAANGDGGEIYKNDGTTVSICCTQDGGTPGIQRFKTWGLFNNKIPLCSDGWGTVDTLGRACHITVTYQASGMGLTQIVADTVVSEHYAKPGLGGNMERFYMATGWGRLGWEAYATSGQLRAGAPLVGPAGGPATPANLILTDRRLVTNIVAQSPAMSVSDYGWPPVGFTP